MSTACPADLVHFAEELAEASGAVIRPYFRSHPPAEDKADLSPVTVADREAELALRALIEKRHPSHGIIGEEYGSVRESASHIWVLDPIDGTRAFTTGKPMFGTLIALLRDGQPLLGVIDQPVLRERWLGAAGRPSTFKGAPARVRSCPGVGRAILNATNPMMFKGVDAAAFARVQAAAKQTNFGGDCYAYGLLASGHIDLVIESGLNLYDFAALAPVIEGAGGLFTDWQGKRIERGSDGHVLAAGDAGVHREALGLLAAR
ncbi:MAG: histidinol-phosphatase [Proteobacteria bacterium]|nr:histidinol-phosphatase [Pseudomonadota bacterium]MBI3496434.1 histidinol-phosphatase [Pseudomonadota bacterium]